VSQLVLAALCPHIDRSTQRNDLKGPRVHRTELHRPTVKACFPRMWRGA
jgi:hypothetical protein